ncbi:MAG: RNA polymerase sigma factor [Ignavibacteriaceae bacterium]
MDKDNSNLSSNSDEELMNLLQKGNTDALKLLYNRYNNGIFNFTLRYTNNREISEDILQEVFTRIWRSSHTFDPDKGTFKTWLFTIGINLTRKEMSKKRYDYDHLDFDEIRSFDTQPERSDDNLVEKTELKDTIEKALAGLNPFLKEVVILKYFQNLKFTEIEEMTKIPVGTLKARFHNALGQLRKLLENQEL